MDGVLTGRVLPDPSKAKAGTRTKAIPGIRARERNNGTVL
jgi:hypothetical protein